MREQINRWFILFAVLMACTLIGMGIATIQFFMQISAPRDAIESNSPRVIEKAGTYQLYCEAPFPPMMESHAFQFTNIQTGEVISSYPPTSDITYSANSVTINSQIVSGTFGRCIALVDLDAGTYTVSFAPAPPQNTFVWGNPVTEYSLLYIIKTFVLLCIFFAFALGLSLSYGKRKKVVQ